MPPWTKLDWIALLYSVLQYYCYLMLQLMVDFSTKAASSRDVSTAALPIFHLYSRHADGLVPILPRRSFWAVPVSMKSDCLMACHLDRWGSFESPWMATRSTRRESCRLVAWAVHGREEGACGWIAVWPRLPWRREPWRCFADVPVFHLLCFCWRTWFLIVCDC